MRYPRKWQLAVVCLLALTLLPFAPAPRGTAQAPGYTVTDLGTLGGEASRAYGLNECGQVVGESQAVANPQNSQAPFRPFLWNGSTMNDLGTLGGSSGTAYGVNQNGTVVGSALTAGGLLHPFYRPLGGPSQDLGTLGGFSAEAQDINASNQVVGETEDTGLQDRAYLWQPGVGMLAMGAAWGSPIRAFGINDAGQIAGSANLQSSGTHAFVTISNVCVDIGTLGGAVSVATEVNNAGAVVGYSYIFSPTITQFFHAFYWKDTNNNGQSDAGEMIDLGVLGTDKNSYAHDLNSSGVVVGYSENAAPGDSNVKRAFIWTSADGLRDLNTVVTGTGWTFQEARGINNRGQIVGTGLNPDGKVHAFLLTPTNVGPSPCDPTPTPTPTPAPGTLQFSAPTYAVGEGGGSALIPVSRTGGSDGTVTVSYSVSNGTATTPGDYTATTPGTLTFGPGVTTQNISVTLNDDALNEPDETVNLTLSTPGGGATLGAQSTAVLTINDNDAPPTLSISDAADVTEGNAGTTTLTYNVTLSAASGQTVTVNYATADGTATAGSDYTAKSGTLTFNPGDTTPKTINVTFADDMVDEPNETVLVNLSSPSNATINRSQGVGTIIDDDGAPALSINDVTVTEGNAGTTNATFTVTLSPASGQAVSVGYATSDGTATTANGDYAAKSGTLNFAVGETSKTFTVNVNGDTTPEAHETFNVTLSGASNASISDSTGVGTINNDDAALTISDVSADEGNSGVTNFTFAVGFQFPTVNTVTVNYATTDGTATAGSDYTAVGSTTLTFNPGETSRNVAVQVNGDTTFEGNETFNLNLSSPTNATISDNTGVGTINNDDTAPNFSINDVTVTEGDTGTVTATFNVTLSAASGLASSVQFATADNTATQPGDYTAVGLTTLNFAAGDTSKPVSVTVKGDTLYEGDETFFVNLSNASGAGIADAQGIGKITDDDLQPALAFLSTGYVVGEGDGKATITVLRTGGTNGGVSVNYSTANGSATAGSDYTATSGTVTFGEGEMSKTFTVDILEDTIDEVNETVNLSLIGPSGATLDTRWNTAQLAIFDNDPPPSISIEDVTVPEGGGTAQVKIKLSGVAADTVNATVKTSNGTATATTFDPDPFVIGDYHPVQGLVVIGAGVTEVTVSVPINDDAADEPDETFFVTLSDVTYASAADLQAVVTILDDDDQPTLSVNDVTVTEGNTGTKNAAFTVTLTPASGKAVTVNYSTANGTATAGSDYTAASSTLTFNPGETTKTVNVPVIGDALDEPNETFNLNLSSPTNATISDGTGVGTITDDDPTPTVSVNDVTVTEGNSGTTAANFTVTLSAASGQTVLVSYTTSDLTATQPDDYVAALGTLSFAPGETAKTITVNVNGDTTNEPNETFLLSLTGAANALVSDGQGLGTINNDDTPTLRFSQAAYPAAESSHFVTITVTRTGDPAPLVDVNFATSDGTATERKDYTAVSGRLLFSPGETSKTFDVLLTEDAYTEPQETINLTLSNPTGGAALGSPSTAIVNLAADDNPPPGANPIDVSSDFVRQHYHDFLNREPDASGLAFWTQEIEQCGTDQQCREVKRINVSAAFFLSIEFQQTGYFVYRVYKTAYGDATSPNVDGTVPVIRLQEFLPDTRRIGDGVVVGQGNWQGTLETNKQFYLNEFVQRPRFLAAFPSTMTAAQFVDTLNQNAGGVLTQSERDQMVASLAPNPNFVLARAAALRGIAESAALQQNELRRAFVLMQFYGYLRRNPDDPQDTDFRGWKFWLDKLNQFNGNYVQAEMVKAFLDSIEYRTRFAP